MDLLKKLQRQLFQIWQRWDRVQRLGIVVVACLCVAATIGISMWASSREFVTLTNNLTPTQAHEVISTLQSEDIKYQLNFSGSSVSVPASDVSRARIALKQTIADSADTEEAVAAGFFEDPGQQRARQQRARERHLAQSIEQFRAVQAATVHLSERGSSPFIRDQTPAKASVVLKLKPGVDFSGADAQAIVSMVSHAIEGLDPENTIIVDTEGHVLSTTDAIGGNVSGQLEFRRKLETDKAAKAEAMLVPILGPGRAVVRVTADIDFTEKQTAKTSFDPDNKVKSSETINTETTQGQGRANAVTGTGSNIGAPSNNDESERLSDIETIQTEYLNSETVDTIREAPGKLIRLTVAAVVDLSELNPDGENPDGAPAFTTTQIEGIIKQAVGFDELRNDQIEVLSAKMTGLPLADIPPGWFSQLEQLAPLAGSMSLGLASLIALFLGMKMIGRLKPVVVEVERSETIDPEVRSRLADLSQEILQHPEAVTTVLAGWLADQQDAAASTKQKPRKVA